MRRTFLIALWLLCGCPKTSGNVLTPVDGGTCQGLPCAGCCSLNGVCQDGVVVTACGVGGAACAACTTGQRCQGGVCITPDAGPVLCRPCLTATDCGAGADCVQYGESDYCGAMCNAQIDCGPAQICVPTLAYNGDVVEVCAPANGSCGGPGCGTCPPGSTCNVATATCTPTLDGGPGGVDAGACGTLEPPNISSCCHSCTPGTGDCQPNGCYGGWWCDTSGTSCRCKPPPTSCGDGGTSSDGGVFDGGPPTGVVGVNGGTVSRLYFAIVGDTRPNDEDDTDGYPSAVITRIYTEIAALNPPVQFVLSTGDYVFATPDGGEGPKQIALYASASQIYTHGLVFYGMGNQECTGFTDSNCPFGTTGNNTYDAYLSTFVTPLAKSHPYYTLSFTAKDGSWTAKLVQIACNAWDDAQKSWLSNTLGQSTTYTFIARHEPLGQTGAPCVDDADPLINSVPFDGFITGHVHTYSHSGKMLIVGNGGAPTTAAYGFVTLEQQPGIGFKMTAYDSSTGLPIDTWYL